MNKQKLDELGDKFLIEGEKVLLNHLYLATGQPRILKPSECDSSKHGRIIDDVMELIKANTMKEKIKAQTTLDVIKLLRAGKVSIGDANSLMSILQVRQNIEELPKLIQALEETTE